ncbi:MAG: HDOD domain-containing protein [Planctomycetota bacterium]|nr:HDOD domain-containing protein [Planctomycetota bacterium]
MSVYSLRDVFGFERIPTIPEVAKNLFRQLQEPKINFARFTDSLRFDPWLVCAFVGAANAKLNGSAEVSCIQNAILECGPRKSVEILQQVSQQAELEEGIRLELLENAWANCITQGIAAESLQPSAFQDEVSAMFLVGLLSDIGILALIQAYPEDYYQKVWSCQSGLVDLQTLEQEVFGFSHVTVGHELARIWRLGESFSSAILQHHLRGNGCFLTISAQASSGILEVLNAGDAGKEKREGLQRQLEECFRMSAKEVDLLLEKVRQRRDSVLRNLGLRRAFSAC